MSITRRSFGTRLAAIAALPFLSSRGVEKAASQHYGCEALSIRPLPLSLKVEHIASPAGCVTLIGRSFADPSTCTLCPRSLCNHDGGFCMVRVEAEVPANLCATYALPAAGVDRQEPQSPVVALPGGTK